MTPITSSGRRHTCLLVVLWLSFVGLVFAFLGFRDYCAGTDPGIHYSFAAEMVRLRSWPLPDTAYLWGMGHYPPLSHIVAIAVGFFAGSILHGVLIASAIFLVITYVALCQLARSSGPIETGTTLTLLVAGMYLSRRGYFFEGNELFVNFSFAQMAGTAALLWATLSIFKLSLPFHWWLITAAISTHLLGWIYTVSGIELAATCSFFVALRCLDSPSRRAAGKVIVTATLLGAAAILHPTMIGSTTIASVDGGISINAVTMTGIFMFSILASAWLFFQRRRTRLVNANALLSLNLAVATLCGLQYAAYTLLSIGSPYAVKKYGYLQGSLAILIVAGLMAPYIVGLLGKMFRDRPVYYLVEYLTPPIVCVVLFFIVANGRAYTRYDDLKSLDDEAGSFIVKSKLREEMIGNTVLWDARFSPHANFTVGIKHLRPLEINDQHALLLGTNKLRATTFILADVATAHLYDRDCIRESGETYSVIYAKCGIKF